MWKSENTKDHVKLLNSFNLVLLPEFDKCEMWKVAPPLAEIINYSWKSPIDDTGMCEVSFTEKSFSSTKIEVQKK